MKHGPILTKAEAQALGKSDPRCCCGYRKSAHVGEPCNDKVPNRDPATGFSYSQGFNDLYEDDPA